MIQFRDAVQGDLVAIAPLLREADAEEWRMGSGKRPKAMIEEDDFHIPDGPWDLNRVALDAYGTPLLLYGVNQYGPRERSPREGWVWLIANARAPAYYREFVPHWDDELYLLGQVGLYDRFTTASWVGNEMHHRWLEVMGFQRSGEPFPHGPYGALFQPFVREVS